MINVNFNITATRTNCFTASQAAKVDAGIQIFKQVINSNAFENRVSNYHWRTADGVTFNRFFMSNGMSNDQVGDMICGNMNWRNGLTNVVANIDWRSSNNGDCPIVNILPCANVQEWEVCCNSSIPCIGMDVNNLNNTWYTPVHVACAMMHEWCCMNGFNCTTPNPTVGNWVNNCVPVACAWICKEVSMEVCNTSEVNNWCNSINPNNFNYCACSMTYANWTSSNNWISPVSKIDECMNMMEREMNWLTACNSVTPDVSNRMNMLTNCINMMSEMKNNLCHTSLDGCDVTCTPVSTVSMASAN